MELLQLHGTTSKTKTQDGDQDGKDGRCGLKKELTSITACLVASENGHTFSLECIEEGNG